MQNTNTKSQKRDGRMSKKLISLLLFIAMMLQTLSVCCFAISDGEPLFGDSSSENGGIVNGLGGFDSDETISRLKKELIASMNKDLIKKIEDYELKGEVSAIITFSENSLVSAYTGSSASKKMNFADFRKSTSGIKLKDKLAGNQASVLSSLEAEGLIKEVEYTYFNIMDGAAVKTTYENIDAITKHHGVERVMISNSYLPAVAVDNPVDVYETGIFNSSDIKFTGKGTIVAVLDTGCDYTHSAFTSYTVLDPAFDRARIEALLDKTVAYSYDNSLEAREVYYGNLTGGKIAFGYDYADKDPDIMPFSESHGTHVAGVIGGKDDVITGVAIDTQFAIMKVFSDYKEGADDDDILAALEDSVTIGVDAINMSLGTSCGFTREVDDQYKNDVYDRIRAAGISLVVAASNDYSSGMGGEESNTNKTENPDSATVGSPSTYEASMSVASINGRKEKYMFVNGTQEVFFTEAFNMKNEEYNFFEMLGITKENPRAEFEYVTIPGNGYQVNYIGLEMEGKIALVRRGDITFEQKVQYAREAGAAAIIIYNNVFGNIAMTVGNDLQIPVVSIGKDEGDFMAASPTGKITFDFNNVAGPFMSDFSSWGPTPSLTLKPEITAHGGNILSAVVGGEYDELSGTSMAAPNFCGITVLIRQYINEKYDLTTEQTRDLVNQLCMSTATIALDKKGNPYSPRKQGAGIADISKATETPAYLYVDNGSGKTKLELGDDPKRSGVYEMVINLKNVSDKSVSYRLGSIVMTESISTSEPEYVAEMAYLLSAATTYEAVGGTITDGVITVAAGGEAVITATVTLSAADKAYINSTFKNGMYVEGYLTFDNVEEKGIDLNAPFLAFYGDWGEAPIFDLDFYEVETEAHNDAIDDDEKIKADYYATTPLGTYYYDYLIPLGSYIYEIDKSKYNAIPATMDKAAVSYYADAISGIYGVFAGLLRGAKEMTVTITDTSTGQVVKTMQEYNCYKSHYSGAPRPYSFNFDLPMIDTKNNTVFGGNNTRYEVTMTAKLDWNAEERNSSDTYTFSFYIDYEAPTVVSAEFRTEPAKNDREEDRYYADIFVYDNHYAMSIRPVIIYDYTDEKGETKKTYSVLSSSAVPIYQEGIGQTTKVTIEITDYIDIIAESENPEGLMVYIDDYAMNGNLCYIPFDDVEDPDLEFDRSELNLDKNDTADLTKLLFYKDTAKTVNDAYLKTLTWTSSNENVVKIHGGQIEAVGSGSAVISVTGSTWKTASGDPIKKNIQINVSKNESDNPNSSDRVPIEELTFTSYYTKFAFNGDIDFSMIGSTGSINHFGGNNSITCYPSEMVQLNYSLKPWNIDEDRYELLWSSSNPDVATVDSNGVVTAQKKGFARITLNIKFGNSTSILAARCSVNVKSEFVIENRILVAYKGWGGDVEIPDNEGIYSIGSFAFCHYNLNNELEVEKDENGYYDLDLKKEPLGNNTVTSVFIPDGVQKIEKYAFYNCRNLSDVTLGADCETIGEHAFESCNILENINLENVKIVLDYAFKGCESLTCKDLGGVDMTGIYAIGIESFAETRLDEVYLPTLSRVSEGAFANCKWLTTVELGEKTRIAPRMFENTAITEIVIYSDSVSDYAFAGCNELTSVEIKNDITYLGEEAFSGCTKLSSVVLDGVCEEIADLAFYKCTGLKSFTLPDCDVVLGSAIFAESGITKLTFSKNTLITECGVAMFYGVKGSVTADVTTAVNYKLENGVVYSNDGTRILLVLPGYASTTFTVPASVKEIGDGAFSSATKIQTVNFDNGSQLTYIGNGAFANCTALKNVVLPKDNSIVIGDYAFSGTVALTAINLEKVTELGDYAFADCGAGEYYKVGQDGEVETFYVIYFPSSTVSNVNLTSDNVVIGEGAFYNCTKIGNVKLGKSAYIGDYAFAQSSVTSVDINGGEATVNEGSFAVCVYLTSFDFADVVGSLGEMAFYACISLSTVNAPNVTEIGRACFADCYELRNFSAPKLKTIGAYAFAPYNEQSGQGAAFQTVDIPSVEFIGEGAFNACINLKSIDLSGVTEVDFAAFYMCIALERVTLGENLETLPDYAFFGCEKLTFGETDLANIVNFGTYSFYGAKLPAHLELTKAEVLGFGALSEMFPGEEDKVVNYIETINAPNLKQIGDQAFYFCKKLTAVNAPKLEEIGISAFAYTAIKELEISENFNNLGDVAFEGCTDFTAFYTTVNGEKKYTYGGYEKFMLKEGVLYTSAPVGYILECYPIAKTGELFEVAEGTSRIAFGAAFGNKFLKRVVLPESLEFIGNMAFFECTALETVVFKSYYAPVLEGTMSGETINITPDTVKNYPKFDKLYKYDYYFRMENVVAYPVYYSTFLSDVASKRASELTYVIPKNSSGYDARIYNAYFDASETEDAGTVTGPYAIAFMNAVEKLPDVLTRFDEALINEAINTYNALEGTVDADLVDKSYFDKFFEARVQFNVSVMENKINHLFDMDNSEYCYNLVKETVKSFEALSEEEQALVKNAATLDAKKADLAQKMGKTLDFTLEYKDYFPVDDGSDDNNTTEDGNGWVVAVIIVASVAVLAAAAVAVFFILKKKNLFCKKSDGEAGKKED